MNNSYFTVKTTLPQSVGLICLESLCGDEIKFSVDEPTTLRLDLLCFASRSLTRTK